ncbi:hypothetical protein BD779DRAFT_1613941 [Infundibulicybe gibba]|nr:hypothetical protein BD779DRAFT_1613941 [Infundibulicybe gibba]
MVPGVNAASMQDSFPDVTFKAFNQFVNANFDTKVSLATVLMVLFTMTDNTDLLNLHARQKHPTCDGEYASNTTGWMKSLARGIKARLQSDIKILFTKSQFAQCVSLSPYDSQGAFQTKLHPVSYDAIQSVKTICPASVECEDIKSTKIRDVPKVKLITGTSVYHNVAVLSGKCSKCKSIYYADHEHVMKSNGDSIRYLKIGREIWVDRVFSNAVIGGMYSFHASAAAYTDFWNDAYGNANSTNEIKITRRHIWQAFIQESTRSVAFESKLHLELDDNIPINEVTTQAFSILGENGHACSECTQPFSATPEYIPQQDPAAVVGVDENDPALDDSFDNIEPNASANHQTDNANADYAPVKMVVLDGIVMGPTAMHVVGYSVSIMRSYMVQLVVFVAVQLRSPAKFYCVETICAPCGVVIAWTKFDKSESPTNILNFLEDIYPTEESRPDYICIDKACLLLRSSIANGSWDMWSKTSRFIVDSYHYINHRTTDYICRKWCNPAPLNGSAPNLVVIAYDKQGNPYYKRAYNTQACEQLNSWLGGFESILKRMTPGNFNWFLHQKAKRDKGTNETINSDDSDDM